MNLICYTHDDGKIGMGESFVIVVVVGSDGDDDNLKKEKKLLKNMLIIFAKAFVKKISKQKLT